MGKRKRGTRGGRTVVDVKGAAVLRPYKEKSRRGTPIGRAPYNAKKEGHDVSCPYGENLDAR